MLEYEQLGFEAFGIRVRRALSYRVLQVAAMSIWDVIGVNLVPVADIVSAVFLGSYSNPNPNLGSH